VRTINFGTATGPSIDLTDTAYQIGGYTAQVANQIGVIVAGNGGPPRTGGTEARFSCANGCGLPACNMVPYDLQQVTTCGPIGAEGVWHHDPDAGAWVNKSGGAGACSDAIGCKTLNGKTVTSAAVDGFSECLARC
jgi:hypothetical protein